MIDLHFFTQLQILFKLFCMHCRSLYEYLLCFSCIRYGLKWKQLYELFDKKKEMLEKELDDEKQKLEEQIEYAKYQHETELLRESEFI